MNHSQKPSIDILTRRIEKYQSRSGSYPRAQASILTGIIQEIQLLPQSPSVESLLEENVGYSEYVTFSNMTTYWVAQTRKETAYGDSPLLALLALKEKLNNNNQ